MFQRQFCRLSRTAVSCPCPCCRPWPCRPWARPSPPPGQPWPPSPSPPPPPSRPRRRCTTAEGGRRPGCSGGFFRKKFYGDAGSFYRFSRQVVCGTPPGALPLQASVGERGSQLGPDGRRGRRRGRRGGHNAGSQTYVNNGEENIKTFLVVST